MNGDAHSDSDIDKGSVATITMEQPDHQATAEHLVAGAMQKVVKFIMRNVDTNTENKTAVVSDSQWEYALSANNIFEQLDTAISTLTAEPDTDVTDLMTPVPGTLALGETPSSDKSVVAGAEDKVVVVPFDTPAQKILWTQLELHNFDTFNVLYQAIAVEASKAAHDKLKALDELLKSRDDDDLSKKWRGEMDADKFREGYALWKLIEKAPRTLVIKVKAEIREIKAKMSFFGSSYSVDGTTTVTYRSYPKDIKCPGASIQVKLQKGSVQIVKF